MPGEELGLELMRLYHDLKDARDPEVKAAIRQQIDEALDRAHANGALPLRLDRGRSR